MLYAAQANSKALQRVTPYIPNEIPKERLSQQAEIALASFKAGVCVSANLSIGQFDSHANNDADQMKLIPEFLAGIAYLMRRAEDLKIRDKLVVIVQSEMGRTPTYNAGNGKDHWSIGSIHVPRAGASRATGSIGADRREAVRTSRSTRRRWPADKEKGDPRPAGARPRGPAAVGRDRRPPAEQAVWIGGEGERSWWGCGGEGATGAEDRR